MRTDTFSEWGIDMSNNRKAVDTRTATYADLDPATRGLLLASLDMSDPVAAMERMTYVNTSSDPVNDADAATLGWVTTYIVGTSESKTDLTVTRRRARGRIGTLESFIASLDGGAVNIDPDSVCYVRDIDGNEVEVTKGKGDTSERVYLVDHRQTIENSELLAKLEDGSVFACANGKRIDPDDVGGEDAWFSVSQFSRDGGENWHPVVWKMTLPRV